MTFIKEYISEEDKKKFGHTSTWTIDRERGVFLIPEYGRESQMEFQMYNLSDGKVVLRAKAKDKSSGNPQDGLLRWYEIYNLFVIESLRSKENELVNILVEALDVFGHGITKERIENCTVKVTFPNHKFGGAK